MKNESKKLSPKQAEYLLEQLKNRFLNNTNRHKGLEWNKIKAKLLSQGNKMWSLNEREFCKTKC